MENCDNSECLYEILECSSTATLDEIRRSYQNLARIHHPDKNATKKDPEDPEMFVRIDRAWKVLRDPELRKQYDAEAAQKDYDGQCIVNESLRKEELDLTAEGYEKSCRCGGSYFISKEEMDEMQTSFYLSCSECSLTIEVLINEDK